MEHLGRDDSLSLNKGDRVEIVDDDYVLDGRPGRLAEVIDIIDSAKMTVELIAADDIDTGLPLYDEDSLKHPLLRRWDYSEVDPTVSGAGLAPDGAILVVEGDDHWMTLEDGVEIRFAKPVQDPNGPDSENTYRTGDYWFIPARITTGDVEWPSSADGPAAIPPHGVTHHYAPLAVILGDEVIDDCQCSFEQFCPSLESTSSLSAKSKLMVTRDLPPGKLRPVSEVKGIGEELESRLNEAGIASLDQFAKMDAARAAEKMQSSEERARVLIEEAKRLLK